MVSSSFEIQGAENVERHISAMLCQAEKRLETGCDQLAPEMLFAVLEGANYICLELTKPKGEGFTLTVPVLQALRWFTVALDPLLRVSGGIIRPPSVKSLQVILDRLLIITVAIADIQYWKRVQEVHMLDPLQSVIVDGDRFIDPEQLEFYLAADGLMTELGPDISWRKHFSEQIFGPKWEKIRPLYNEAFWHYYRLEASDFATLEAYFKGVAQNHTQKVASLQILPLESNRPDINLSRGFPQAMNIVLGILQGCMPAEKLPRFTPLEVRDQVLNDTKNLMHGKKEQSQKWLSTLEYRPGAEIFRHPLVPLIEGKHQVYALLPWAFYPLQMCGEQWDGKLFLFQKPRSDWADTMGEWYGNGFRDYVVDTLRKAGIENVSIEQELPMDVSGDEARAWLDQLPKKHGKSRQSFPPIDIIAQNEEIVLFISCKALDLYFDYWLLRNHLYVPAKVIRDSAKMDIEHLNEISIEAKCVATVWTIRQRLGFQGKRILPVLVTSRREPLGIDTLRTYFEKTETIPAVPILTANKLRDFATSGFNTQSLHLSFSPTVF